MQTFFFDETVLKTNLQWAGAPCGMYVHMAQVRNRFHDAFFTKLKKLVIISFLLSSRHVFLY